MPKLKHMARFTTPVNLNDAKDTPINTPPPTIVKAPPIFIENVRSILASQTQPLSVVEITELVSRETKHAYDETYIRLALKELSITGKVSSRKETTEERSVRGQGNVSRSMRAMLFWAPAGIVPPRTVAEAVPGLTLFNPETYTARKIYKYPTKKIQRAHLNAQLVEVTPLPVAASSSAVVDYLIEKMVTERTTELQAQLDAANAKLAKLQELFKSAL
jgi:hypothetical protein